MSEKSGGETIKQMLAGFNSMQMQLGLLPSTSGQQPLGVQLNQPPPPPPMPHPSDFAMQVSQQQQMMMQQTMQMAQTTRYQPPPSSPQQGGGGGGFTWGSSYAQMGAAQMNPMVANAMGGGAGVGMPNPIYATAPQYGGYRPQGPAGGMMAPMAMRPPPIFNPFAPQLPTPHFMTPMMQNYQVMQARQAESMGLIGGAVEGGLGIGGSLLGGALGSAFGPLGSVAGSMAGQWLGDKVSNATIGPAFADVRRGRQIQSMTAPWMVGGPNLNPFTGQGMNREAATDTARQLRTMVRDHDFQRTGFNTQDVMKITQLASDQGLLQTAQNPDEIARKVKDISKSIKALVQITGDPDVRNAIASLGQMRQLGFEGLGGQMGAIANRAAFARMAGVSQAAAHEQFGMPGAMMAQNMGLAGSTGYSAGVMGGGMANMAVHGGAMTDLQLSRAGGKSGLAQTNAMAALGAIQQPAFMMAALTRGKNGEIGIDENAYRKATEGTIEQAAAEGARRMAGMSPAQLAKVNGMLPELSDKLAQKIGPDQMFMNAGRQAEAMMKSMHGTIDLQGAFTAMTGGNEKAGRDLYLEYSNRGMYDSRLQQLGVQRREQLDRNRARFNESRTPGGLTQIGRGFRDVGGELSDMVSSPVRSLMERSNRADEDIAAQEHGETTFRVGGSSVLTNRQERDAAFKAGQGAYAQRLMKQAQGVDVDSRGNMAGNRLAHLVGFGAYNERNQTVNLANQLSGSTFDWHTTYGDYGAAKQAMTGAQQVAQAADRGQTMSVDDTSLALKQIQSAGLNSGLLVSHAFSALMNKVPGAGLFTSASGVTKDAAKDVVISEMQKQGKTKDQALALWNADPEKYMALLAQRAYQGGNKSEMEKFDRVREVVSRYSTKGKASHEDFTKRLESDFSSQGLGKGKWGSNNYLGNASDEDVESARKLIGTLNPHDAAYIAAKATLAHTEGMGRGASDKDLNPQLVNARKRAQALVDKVEGGTDTKELARIHQVAADYSRSMKDGTRLSLANIAARGSGGLEEQIGGLQEGVRAGGYEGAMAAGASKLGLSGTDPLDLLSQLSTKSPEELAKLPADVRKAVKAYQSGRGDTKAMSAAGEALQKAFLDSAPAGVTDLIGAPGATPNIDKTAEDVRAMRDRLAGGEDTGDAIADSMGVMADAMEKNTAAVNELKLWLVANPHGSK